MNINKFFKDSLAALNDATSARNVNEWRKKFVAALTVIGDAPGVTTTATAAEINMAADNSANVEVVAAANVITADESGKTFFLNLAGGFASTLPAPAAGLRYKFVVSVSPTTAYTIVTNASANIIKGGAIELAGTASPYINNGDLITFVANTAVVGDWVEVISDGTSWFLAGMCSADGGITLGST